MTASRNPALLIVGYFLTFYGGFCLLGGPDGAILSRDSFMFGVPSLAISGLLVSVSGKSVPLRGFAFAPFFVVLFGWLVATVGFQMAAFYIWLFGTTASSLAVVMYWSHVESSLPRS